MVCPRCLTPLAKQAEAAIEQPGSSTAAPTPAIDLSALQRETARGSRAKPREMTAEMRRLMEGPMWTTRRTQFALTVFLLVVAIAVLVMAVSAVSRRNAEYYLGQGRGYFAVGQ